ncbi:hypothetical protein WN55_05985, partial [Dufourea novaeangliae]
NAYEYNSNVVKDAHRENADFYNSGNNGHPLSSGRSQGSLEESLRSNSYNGFSPNSHSSSYQGFSSNARETLGASPYFINDPAQSSFEGYANTNTNGDSTFGGYTQSADQTVSEFSQFANNKQKSPSYTRFSDNLPATSNAASFPELASESSSLREYAADAFRSHGASGGYMDGDQTFSREPSSLFNSPTNDYSYGKHKENMFATSNSNKYTNDAYTMHPETRYVGGNHANAGRDYGSSMYLPNSGSSMFNNLRGNSDFYSSGKYSKYNKYLGEYAPHVGLNYLSKDQEPDHLFGNYGKVKAAALKDGRPSSYGSQAYLGGPSHLSKIAGSYKVRPSFMNYASNSPIGYSSMSSVHSSLNGNNYMDNPMLRRYRSSSGYIPGHGNIYSGYY